jgi:hypothetical protein
MVSVLTLGITLLVLGTAYLWLTHKQEGFRPSYRFDKDPLMYTDDGMYYHDLAWSWPLYTTYWTGGGFYGGPYNVRWNGGRASYPWTATCDETTFTSTPYNLYA